MFRLMYAPDITYVQKREKSSTSVTTWIAATGLISAGFVAVTATATHVYSRMNLNVRNQAVDNNDVAQSISKSAGSTDLFTSILGILGHSAKEAIKTEVNKVGDKIKKGLKEVENHIGMSVAALGIAGHLAGEDIKKEINKIPQKLNQAGKEIQNAFNSVGTAISGTVNSAVGGLVNSAAQTIVNSVQKGIESGVQSAVKEVEKVVKDDKTPTGQAVGTIIKAAENVIKDIAQSNEAASRNPVQPTRSFWTSPWFLGTVGSSIALLSSLLFFMV